MSIKKIYQTKLLYPEIIWERPVHYYKTHSGRILVLAGSRGSQGAALMSAEAIFRSGTGILTLGFPESLKSSYIGILPEAMTLALPETHSGSLARSAKSHILDQLKAVDVVLIGPGLSTNTETVQLIWDLLPEIKKSLVIDAEGLQALAYGIDAIRGKEGIGKLKEYFANLKSKIIITPHPGEASHILAALGVDKKKCKISYIEKHREETAETIFDHLKVTVVLKGHDAIIYNGKSLVIDKTHDLSSATTESDDVLSGIIASFIAQNPQKTFRAICVSVYLYYLSMSLAQKSLDQNSVMAKDIIRFLPEAIKATDNES